MRNKTIHFWVLYPESSAPSQRFRVELYLPFLAQNGFSYELLPFLDPETWRIFYKKGKGFKRLVGILKGFFRRTGHLFKSRNADYIFILREASPVGPPVFEFLLSKVFRKKIIYDFDDAIWLPGGEKASRAKKWLKATWKIKYIIKWAYKISAGNNFLAEYALKYNPSVFVVPTVVDTQAGHYLQKDQRNGNKITIGWTGTHTTLHNLELIEDVIQELKNEVDFDFLIISNKPPDWDFDFIYKEWNVDTEQEDLLKMHIGIMPLKSGPWFEGKCGFKLIQYHSCGIPAVASPLPVNKLITLHNETGFIAGNRTEWKNYLKELLQNTELRAKMGIAGREHIEKNFSLHSLLPVFVSLFS